MWVRRGWEWGWGLLGLLYTRNYYKMMWVQFTSPCSLDQGIHCFSTCPYLLEPIHSKFSEITCTPLVPIY